MTPLWGSGEAREGGACFLAKVTCVGGFVSKQPGCIGHRGCCARRVAEREAGHAGVVGELSASFICRDEACGGGSKEGMKPSGNARQVNVNAVNAVNRKTAPVVPNSSPARKQSKTEAALARPPKAAR